MFWGRKLSPSKLLVVSSISFLCRNYCLSAKFLYLDTPDPHVKLGTYKMTLPRYPGPWRWIRVFSARARENLIAVAMLFVSPPRVNGVPTYFAEIACSFLLAHFSWILVLIQSTSFFRLTLPVIGMAPARGIALASVFSSRVRVVETFLFNTDHLNNCLSRAKVLKNPENLRGPSLEKSPTPP